MLKGIVIDESKCDGCGLCVEACHEGALAIVNGKAKMVREDFCDGLGHCLPACPRGAISFIEMCGCETPKIVTPGVSNRSIVFDTVANNVFGPGSGELRQWPVKLKLISAASPIFRGADILLAADCSAFAYSKIHEEMIKGRAVAICCPKFETGLKEKLTEVIKNSDPKSLTVVKMTVPCCSLNKVAHDAIADSGKNIPLKIITLDQRGCLVRVEE
ncbi:electron transport complex subunit RsxB [Candidatus Methanoplasma termitum]|uniref:RsxB protein n=1 Tax=Candidatus Methanoplasma termitum TaxID=1577791 RepID=A0A0A7LGU2_9ARCH|nr:4Fe-4S binding protein [Candidatus Methanoplasma termitum]AIZ56716.1 electron transport complex subunit RsxB [Candidatus Methanoplasma termitum]MCL2333350.1 4Fe-4S binding protein [Candidatus Methanoplasma sp.]